MRKVVLCLMVLVLILSIGRVAGAGLETPVAVSPGDPASPALIDEPCPTFSWGEVEGAAGYELVVVELGEGGADAEPVLRERFAGSVDGWTPSLGRCLERGKRYAWSVRAADPRSASTWSTPSLFEVASGPTEAELAAAVELVGKYLAARAAGEGEQNARRETPLEALTDENERLEITGEAQPPATRLVTDPSISTDGDLLVGDSLQVNNDTYLMGALEVTGTATLELDWGNLSNVPAGFADGVDAYNSGYDTEEEIDAAVANNGFSTGAHTVDTNAATLCTNGQFLNGDGTCDLADSSGKCTIGRVCTGGHGHPPSEITTGTLDIGSGKYTHDDRTGYLNVPGSALTPPSHSVEYFKSVSGFVSPIGSSTSFYGHAPLDLPHGATITQVTAYSYKNATSAGSQNWRCSVYRRNNSSATSQLALGVNATINFSPSTAIRLSIGAGSHTVDKAFYSYWLYAGVDDTDSTSNYRFYGCRIQYSYDNTDR